MKINIYGGDLALKKVVKAVLRKAGPKRELTVVFTDDSDIQSLNKRYRDKDYPTDVLSFPDDDPRYLGDIVISLEKASLQAKEYGHTLNDEVAFLVCHGFLHLNGYDHETPEEEKEMFSKQNAILDRTKYRGGKR